MKKLFGIFTILFTVFFAFSCGQKQEKAAEPAGEKKVAIVYSTGGKGDKSFNDSAFRGLSKAKEELELVSQNMNQKILQ